ncbi:hypothetical protein [Roseibium algicola]|uniref:hypothetical protein n=1 Tax=Roseibium algicola TaxID=2857014 RepID=UPI0012EB0E29|nr:hypothetical protein [Roseibium aggregatum]
MSDLYFHFGLSDLPVLFARRACCLAFLPSGLCSPEGCIREIEDLLLAQLTAVAAQRS